VPINPLHPRFRRKNTLQQMSWPHEI